MTDESDRAAVMVLLGREPAGSFEVVVRDAEGAPVVIRNAPFLDDGTPMPTMYWLVGRREVRAVSRLEAAGGVCRAEAEVAPGLIADAHRRYAAERDRDLPEGDGPRPTGGVGGTREGVKCLHAHLAWFLAGGDDPVGRWIAARLRERLDVETGSTTTLFAHSGRDQRIPVGPATLLSDELADPDPATPVQLTNALGIVTDHLDDVIRDGPEIAEADDVHVSGDEAWHLAIVEHGGPIETPAVRLPRDAVEQVFRILATENRADRLTNPGLDPARVDTVLAVCCLVVALMRRLHLTHLTFDATRGAGVDAA